MDIVLINKMITIMITFKTIYPYRIGHSSNMPLHKYIALKLLLFVDGDPPCPNT